MSISCPKCQLSKYVRNGFVRSKQRYKCKNCFCSFTHEDGRNKYDNTSRSLVIRMYLNNCGFRRIAEILHIPLATCFMWIRNAGRIVDQMVRERRQPSEDIEILEMDELYTFVKKSQEKIKRQENIHTHIPEFGLLWIGTDLKLLRLR